MKLFSTSNFDIPKTLAKIITIVDQKIKILFFFAIEPRILVIIDFSVS